MVEDGVVEDAMIEESVAEDKSGGTEAAQEEPVAAAALLGAVAALADATLGEPEPEVTQVL